MATNNELLRQRLAALSDEQQQFQKKWADDWRRLSELRHVLAAVSGALALGVGLSVGYQLGRR
jgi:hypothetical protein